MFGKLAESVVKNPKTFLTFPYFFIIGLTSWYLTLLLELKYLIGILLFLILLITIGLRLYSIILKTQLKHVEPLASLTTIIFFIFLLVLSSGGIASPFLVITHLFAIGASFLISPGIAVSYILATILIIIPHTFIDLSSFGFINSSPFITFLYFITYITLIPISFTLAREYKIKAEWVNKLERQIATSKSQEDTLLKNIEDAVIVLNKKFEIMYLNEAVTKIFNYTNHALGKNFFSLFLFKDKEGRPVEPHHLPFEQILNSKSQSYIENIQISTENTPYTRVDLKILPVIENEIALGLMLVIKNISSQADQNQEKNIALTALKHFTALINKQKQNFAKLMQTPKSDDIVQDLIRQNLELEILSQDFFYALRLESGEIGSLASQIDIGKILEDIIFDKKWGEMKKNVKIAAAQKSFEKIYIMANVDWFKEGISKLLEVITLLTSEGHVVKVDVSKQDVLAKVEISSALIVKNQDLEEIFRKFYGRLSNLKELEHTSGLEGFIAQNLIERSGGNIRLEKDSKPQSAIFKITFTSAESHIQAEPVNFLAQK